MSEPSDQPVPHYVVCNCHHCEGHIEFDANEFAEENSIIPCPHCSLETKIFVPNVQVQPEQLSAELPTPIAPPSIIRREGFFCGGSEVPPERAPAEHPMSHPLEFTREQITSVGNRSNDEMAVKLCQEGDQDVALSIDAARRYIVDQRFKLTNPETGVRFTPASLEEFIESKKSQKPAETTAVDEIGFSARIEIFPQEITTRHTNTSLGFAKGARIALTQAHHNSPVGQELVSLLSDIVRDGLVSENGTRRLLAWLEGKSESEIPAIQYLRQVSQQVLSDGEVTTAKAFEMHYAIERVLPKSIREVVKEQRQDAWRRSQEASEAQLEYIRNLGGLPPPDLNREAASAMIDQLLDSAKPTERQLEYLRSLVEDMGGNVPCDLTRSDINKMIPVLERMRDERAAQQPPSPRQIMVLRFWNRLDLINARKGHLSAWLEEFYNEDPRRKKAWELFKLENGDDGSQRDPSWVPIGIGERYLNKKGEL